MKQLLTWCGSRALPDKPSGNIKDANAIMAARAIQQELIDEFASRPELSDWFSRVWQILWDHVDKRLKLDTGRYSANNGSQEAEPGKRQE
jgi:hypothetical protein